MKKQVRRFGAGTAAVGAVAGVAAFALPAGHTAGPITAGPAWQPTVHGLTADPGTLLPAVVSTAHPVRVLSTALDPHGRPVVTVRTATDRTVAARFITDGQRADNAVGVELDVPVRVAQLDPYRPAQWDLDRIRTGEAWQQSTGAGVTVAVIDSGVEASHPDLAGQVLPGVDLITGVEGTAVDPHGHGTHVAGTIAALAGNGEGVAGVAPGARILPVRVLGDNGAGYMSDVANGIAYAADHGADVINLSISATVQVGAVSNAVAYARSKGIVVIAAAGNARRAGSPVSFPAADDGVIAVAATDAGDAVAGFSTQGWYVDVAAPGSDIVSTYPVARYGRMSGTSMAAPHVAAVAALLKSHDRALTPDRVEEALKATAVDLGAPGRDDDYGVGRIDAAAALAAVAPRPTTPVVASDPAPSTAADPTATEEPTTAPTQDPTTPAPPTGTPGTSAPTERTPTESPAQPAPTTAVPTPTESPVPTRAVPMPSDAPARPGVLAYLVRTGRGQLTAAIRGADGQIVEVQREAGDGWETIRTYPASLVTRLNDLTPGLVYRIAVPDSPNFTGAASTPVRL